MQHKEAELLEHSLYAELYRHYASSLFAYVYQQTASREDAEDIVLEVFLSVLQNKRFPTFDAKKQEAWLWTITRNKVVDYYRRSIRHPYVPIEWLSESFCEDEHQAPEQISLQREEFIWLSSTIRALPELQQEVLRLRFGHGLKCEEIAPAVEKSAGAVRMILFRTLQSLRRFYKDWEKGEKR
ncbi:MAG TPA: sigma-70 family RNA polymerase sigma factor [Ktedonosporobacter sp.]|jgi:RNA polymerase sigma-70 factor (ECF subfamily)|nr:sigma-70 family RNA polymerase sigma factor [Ktedonosporobacter sp.]